MNGGNRTPPSGSPFEFLEPLTPEGAKEFADRYLIGENGTADGILYEAAQHIYSLVALIASGEENTAKRVVRVQVCAAEASLNA